MDQDKQIRPIGAEELPEALALAWEVFAAQLAPECTDEGVDEFWHSIDQEYMLHRMGDGTLRFWGAFDGERMVGLCAMRELVHVALIFVAEDYQFQGAGTALLKKAVIDCKALDPAIGRITVEALGDSRGFFETLGFVATGDDSFDSGLITTPMALGDSGAQP